MKDTAWVTKKREALHWRRIDISDFASVVCASDRPSRTIKEEKRYKESSDGEGDARKGKPSPGFHEEGQLEVDTDDDRGVDANADCPQGDLQSVFGKSGGAQANHVDMDNDKGVDESTSLP